MKTFQLFLAKFALLCSLLTVCLFNVGGCVIDYSTIQVGCLFAASCSCNQLVGTSGGGSCGDVPVSALPPILGGSQASFAYGFNVQTTFVDTRTPIFWRIYNADQIYIYGLYLGNDTGIPTTGTMYTFGVPYDDPTDPNAVTTGALTAPIPGWVRFPQGIVPGQWTFRWVTSRFSLEYDLLTEPTAFGEPGIHDCAGQNKLDTVVPGQTAVLRCFIKNLSSSTTVEEAGIAGSPFSGTLIAGDLKDLTIYDAPMVDDISAYQTNQVYALTFDINGNTVGCTGSVAGCGGDITVNADGSLTLPAWTLDWADGSIPGAYTVVIFAIDPVIGEWVTADVAAFQITNGGEPVYRYYIPCNGDHAFILGTDPPPYCGYLESPNAFYVYDEATILGLAPDAIPLDRMLSRNGFNFYTDNGNEAWYYQVYYGWWNNGLPLGYVMPYQTPNTVPLYRLFDGGSRHFYTASWDEVMADVQWGWRYEGIQCFLPVGP